MFVRSWQLAGIAGVLAMTAAGHADAQSASDTGQKIDALQEQIQALQRELQQLKGKVSKAEQRAAAPVPVAAVDKAPPPPPTAIVRMSPNNRPSICTPDQMNCIALTSRLHLDVGGYSYRPNSPGTVPQNLDSGVNARRARIGVVGTFMGDWNYALVYDFGGSSDGFGGLASGSLPGGGTSGVENALVSYTGLKPFAIEAGYMDVPYTLDEATSSNDIMFMERATPGVVATNIAAGDFRSAAGIRGNNDRFWAGGYFTGPASGATHIASSTSTVTGLNEQYGAVGRASYQLLQDRNYSLHVGGDVEVLLRPPVNATTFAHTLSLSDRPELRLDPTAILNTGAIANVSGAQVYSAEAAASYGPLYFQGEYFWYDIDRYAGLSSLTFNGGYAQASWVLTGEAHEYMPNAGAYSGIAPAHPFSANGDGWGAWEIAARYSTMDLNDRIGFSDGVAGGEQTVYTLGLNWYVNRNVRFMVNYLHGTIDKQLTATNATDAGAKFDALATRMQVAF